MGSGLVIRTQADGKAADRRDSVRSTKSSRTLGRGECCKEGKGSDPERDYEVSKEEKI